MKCNGVYRILGLTFNVAGLVLGIVGSLMYSPTVNHALFGSKMDTWKEFEWMRHYANLMWAVSFFLFPIGVGFFLVDRWDQMRLHNLAKGKPPPSLWNRNMRVLVWSELMLCIFAVGGVFFCFDHDENAAVTSWILFFCGGCIKLGLLFAELMDMLLGTNCSGGRGAEGDICGGGLQTPLRKEDGEPGSDGDEEIAPAVDTSTLLGDPGGIHDEKS